MKKIILFTLSIMIMTTINAQTSFYSYTVNDIDGNDFSMEQLKGKKVMVVNVAVNVVTLLNMSNCKKFGKNMAAMIL